MASSESKNITLERPPRAFKSPVWDHYGFPVSINDKGIREVDRTVTVCRHCSAVVKYTKGCTTNMLSHMKRHHANVMLESRAESGKVTKTEANPHWDSQQEKPKATASGSGQLRLQDAFKKYLPASSMRAQQITCAVGQFIATDLRPYSVTEKAGFIHLISVLDPRYKMPSRQHFSGKVIPNLYAETVQEVKDSMSLANCVSLTTDGWTSRAAESYITVTAHYMTPDWKIMSPVLQTRAMYDTHTGIHISEVLQSSAEEWNVKRPEMPNPVVTDNASNMGIAVKTSGLGPHIRCFAHTLNLATQRALQISQMSQLLCRVRWIVSFFHRSTHANMTFQSKQKMLQLPQHKLIIDVASRWNSSYDMLERYLEQQEAVMATLVSADVRKTDKELVTFSDDDIANAEQAVALLKPLKTITVILCDEKDPTVSMIVPLLTTISNAMVVSQEDSELISKMKTAISNDIGKRYEDPQIKDFLLICSLLDPRFKSLPQLSDDQRYKVHQSLLQITVGIHNTLQLNPARVWTEPGKPQPEPAKPTTSQPVPADAQPRLSNPQTETGQLRPTSPAVPLVKTQAGLEPNALPKTPIPSPSGSPARKKSAMEDLFGEVFVVKEEMGKNMYEKVQHEIEQYTALPAIHINESPLDWWKVEATRFPLLAFVTKGYLAIPATSVPSERVFSTAGDVVTAQRATLSPENVDMLVFLNKNLKV